VPLSRNENFLQSEWITPLSGWAHLFTSQRELNFGVMTEVGLTAELLSIATLIGALALIE
jgi:hypothetical protein